MYLLVPAYQLVLQENTPGLNLQRRVREKIFHGRLEKRWAVHGRSVHSKVIEQIVQISWACCYQRTNICVLLFVCQEYNVIAVA